MRDTCDRDRYVHTATPAAVREVDMMVLAAMAAPVNLNHTGRYVHWGVIQLSVANLVVIGLMVVVFVLALLLPFPKGRDKR